MKKEIRKSLILLFILFFLIALNIILLNISSTKITASASQPESQSNIEFKITKSKAIKVEQDSFDGNTTAFNVSNGNTALKNITNLTLEKTDFGKILFLESIDLTSSYENMSNNFTRKIDFDKHIKISKNLIEIDTENLPSLEKPAILSLYGLDFNNPRILRNNEPCPASICRIMNYSNGILKFNVTKFSSYSSEETPIIIQAKGGSCTYKWECADWRPLICPETGKQTRECANKGTCAGILEKPDETRICAPGQIPGEELLDVKINIINKEITEKSEIIVEIELINFGETKKVDVILDYKITDDKNEIIFSQQETAALETKLNLIKRISLPKEAKPGKYKLYIIASYGGKSAISAIEFQVIKASQKEKIFILVMLLLITALAILIYIMIKQREKYISIKKADLKKLIGNQK